VSEGRVRARTIAADFTPHPAHRDNFSLKGRRRRRSQLQPTKIRRCLTPVDFRLYEIAIEPCQQAITKGFDSDRESIDDQELMGIFNHERD
jgi:hypothetical protein